MAKVSLVVMCMEASFFSNPVTYVCMLGECMAFWGEPNKLSIQHCVYIFMQYVDS